MNVPNVPLPLLDLTFGVAAFKALAVATELGVFTELSGTSATVAVFAERHGIEERPAELLLTACTALGLLLRDDAGAYRNTDLSEEFLVRGRPYYFGGWVTLFDQRDYPALSGLAEALRGNRPVSWDPQRQESMFVPADPVMVEHFWEGMHALSAFTASRLSERLDLGEVRSVLDVGGGGGAFAVELCRCLPELRVTIFDLPFVCELTRPRITAAGLADRVDLVGGDFFTDPLPEGHDIVLLSNILHDWGEADAQRILTGCAKALPRGGALIICESFVDDDKRGPLSAALISLTMLLDTWGRNYTVPEYTAWLAERGLETERVVCLEGAPTARALIARKTRT
ncbi:methyltransferase [Kitasatospora sp. NPDC058046]|uniref:methyltransferase n=1 Tax=Kitasatospora sp. NPDC058046 TaxID=3346312 RepID=UPI0036DD74C0